MSNLRLIATAEPANGHVSGETVCLTRHAKKRFHGRVKPHLDYATATRELERSLPQGRLSADPPAWFASGTASDAELYLLIGDDVVLPLVRHHRGGRLVAVSCYGRGAPSEAERARQNKRRRAYRVANRAPRRRPAPVPDHGQARRRFRREAAYEIGG